MQDGRRPGRRRRRRRRLARRRCWPAGGARGGPARAPGAGRWRAERRCRTTRSTTWRGCAQRLRGVQLVAATSSDLPLLGFHGASATDAGRRGATPEQAQSLEAALGRFADVAQRSLVAGRSLAGSGLAATAGAGAGGGIGFALLLLGATRLDGVQARRSLRPGFAQRLRSADLVVTGESVFGWHSVRSGVVACGGGRCAGDRAAGRASSPSRWRSAAARRSTWACPAPTRCADRPGWLADVRSRPVRGPGPPGSPGCAHLVPLTTYPGGRARSCPGSPGTCRARWWLPLTAASSTSRRVGMRE